MIFYFYNNVASVEASKFQRRQFRRGFECNKGAQHRRRRESLQSFPISTTFLSSMFCVFFYFLFLSFFLFLPFFFIKVSECNRSIEGNRVTGIVRAIVFNFRNSASSPSAMCFPFELLNLSKQPFENL